MKNGSWSFSAKQPLTVGSDAHCALRRTDAELEKTHFMLAVVDGKPVISALSGETRLNGRAISHGRLKNGDVINAGSCQFEFLTGEKESSARRKRDSKRLSARRTAARVPVFNPAKDPNEPSKRQFHIDSGIRILPPQRLPEDRAPEDSRFLHLYQAMREMSHAATEDQLLKSALACLFKALKFRNAAILLKDTENGKLRNRLSWAENTGPCAFAASVMPSRRLLECAATNKAICIASGLSEDGSTPSTALCAPILHKNELLGAIYVEIPDASENPKQATSLCQFLADDIAAILAARGMEADRQKDASARRRLARHIPLQMADDIAAKRKTLPAQEKREVSILCCELKDAAEAINNLAAEKALAMINTHFTVLSEAVFRNGGMLDKFAGGRMLAVFGAGENEKGHPLSAVKCAQQMQQDMRISLLELTQLKNWPALSLSIVINTGEAVLGDVGAPGRTDYAAIGETVELAESLLRLALGGQILITGKTFEAVKKHVECEEWGSTPVKGKRFAEKLYAVKTD